MGTEYKLYNFRSREFIELGKCLPGHRLGIDEPDPRAYKLRFQLDPEVIMAFLIRDTNSGYLENDGPDLDGIFTMATTDPGYEFDHNTDKKDPSWKCLARWWSKNLGELGEEK